MEAQLKVEQAKTINTINAAQDALEHTANVALGIGKSQLIKLNESEPEPVTPKEVFGIPEFIPEDHIMQPDNTIHFMEPLLLDLPKND